MLLLKMLPNFTVSGGFIISEKPELTIVSICSQTTFPSVHGKVRNWEPFPPGIWQSCTEDPPHADSFCKSAPVSLPVGKNRARLTEVVLQGDGGRVRLPGIEDFPEALNLTFYFRILYLLMSRPQTLCSVLCVHWGMEECSEIQNLAFVLRGVQFSRELWDLLSNNYNANENLE